MRSSLSSKRIAPGFDRRVVRFAAWLAVALCLSAAQPLHAGMIGPALPDALRNQISLGVGYARLTTPLKPESGANFGVVDLRQNVAYLQYQNPAYCFTDDGGGFLRVGVADADDGKQFHGGYNVFGGVGVRDTWFGGELTRFSVGTVVQANVFSGYDEEKSFLAGYPAKVSVRRLWDASLAVPAQWKPTGRSVLYAGPIGFFRTVRVDRTLAGVKETAWYREKNRAGAFGGLRVSLPSGWSLEVEGLYLGQISAGVTVSRAY